MRWCLVGLVVVVYSGSGLGVEVAGCCRRGRMLWAVVVNFDFGFGFGFAGCLRTDLTPPAGSGYLYSHCLYCRRRGCSWNLLRQIATPSCRVESCALVKWMTVQALYSGSLQDGVNAQDADCFY